MEVGGGGRGSLPQDRLLLPGWRLTVGPGSPAGLAGHPLNVLCVGGGLVEVAPETQTKLITHTHTTMHCLFFFGGPPKTLLKLIYSLEQILSWPLPSTKNSPPFPSPSHLPLPPLPSHPLPPSLTPLLPPSTPLPDHP